MVTSWFHIRCSLTIATLFVAVALLLSGAPQAMAEESFRATHFADLDGSQEVPSVETGGLGIAIMRLDEVQGTLEYRITVTGLSGAITGAHFHTGFIGEAGPVVHTINFPAGKFTATGTWTGLTQDDIVALITGGIYVNVHTVDHPGGEIRGQVNIAFNGAASLDGSQEVPANPDTVATGDASLLIDPVAHSVLYAVSWSGLSGPATAAHFHVGAPGVSGGVIHPIPFTPGDSVAFEVWTGVSDVDIASLIAGDVYVNVHTAKFPSGEIRGQVLHLDLYTAAISPTNEVPPASASRAEGTGYAQFSYDPHSMVGGLFVNFVVGNTTSPITAAHIHRGAIGQNGPVLTTLFDADTTSFLGIALYGSDTAATLKSGGLYANFHTDQFPGGEARGQLIPGRYNLVAIPSSVPVTGTERNGHSLSATAETATGAITFHVDDGAVSGNGRITLYSTLGQQVATVSVAGSMARIDGGALPAGMYLAQFVVDGRVMADTRVVIAR